MRQQASAFSPASVGNVGVGFDILGHVIEGVGDTVTVRRIDAPEVRITGIHGATVDLPLDAPGNTAGAALISLREALALPFGFEVEIGKGIPLGSGMGGSAASCVAALVAANALLDAPLTREQLYPHALVGEAVASGGKHGDNLGPMLLGGLVLSTAFILQYIVSGTQWVELHMHLRPRRWIATGLLIATATGLGAFVLGYPFLTTHTAHVHLPLIGDFHVASALFYDIGVFALVVGATLLILTALGHQSVRGHRRPRSTPAPAPAHAPTAPAPAAQGEH